MFPSLQKKDQLGVCSRFFFLLEHFFFVVSRSQISFSLEIAFFFFASSQFPQQKKLVVLE